MMVFRNYKAAFLWGFMAIFMSLVALMTWVLFRDLSKSQSHGVWQSVIMGVFWIAGLGFSAFAASQPCVKVVVAHGFVRIVHRYPFSRLEHELPYDRAKPAQIVESRDSEGDPYFSARAGMVDGLPIDLFESHSRGKCEAVCVEYNAAVFGLPKAPRAPRKPGDG
jgi:hypothetical protein